MSTTTDLTTLKINYLTQAQYDAAVSGGTINENEIYMTPVEDTQTGMLQVKHVSGSIIQVDDATTLPIQSLVANVTDSVQSIIVYRTGKNLFGGVYNTPYSLYLPAGTEVVASCENISGTNTRIYYYDKNMTQIDYWQLSGSAVSGTRRARTFTLKSDTYYFNFGYASCEEMQIELASLATAYEAYKGNTYNISVSGTGEVDLTAEGVTMLYGTNYLWSDGGDLELAYIAEA